MAEIFKLLRDAESGDLTNSEYYLEKLARYWEEQRIHEPR